MFALAQRVLIRGCQAHINAGLGCGADYVASIGTPLVAPADGTLSKQYTGNQGGKWLWFTDKDGNSLQFAHLSKYVGGLRVVRKGELIAYTGNTGQLTTGPHLHVQIISPSGVRLDPEKYAWVDTTPPPANNEPMNRFELFLDKKTGKVYYRGFPIEGKRVLFFVPDNDNLVYYWGVNPPMTKLDNILEAGTPIETFPTSDTPLKELQARVDEAVNILKG